MTPLSYPPRPKHVALFARTAQIPGPLVRAWFIPSTASMAQQTTVPAPQLPLPVDGWTLPFPASEFIAMLLQPAI